MIGCTASILEFRRRLATRRDDSTRIFFLLLGNRLQDIENSGINLQFCAAFFFQYNFR